MNVKNNKLFIITASVVLGLLFSLALNFYVVFVRQSPMLPMLEVPEGEGVDLGGTARSLAQFKGISAGTDNFIAPRNASKDFAFAGSGGAASESYGFVIDVRGSDYTKVDVEIDGTASVSGNAYFTNFTNCNLDTDSSGLLVCGTDANGALSSNALDFDEFVDAMTLDANLTVASGGFTIDLADTEITTGGQFILDVDGSTFNTEGAITFGAGPDAGIYHTGSNLKIETQGAGGGGMVLDSENDTIEMAGSGVLQATFDLDGIDLITGNDFQINNTSVLNATTLGSAVVNSSLDSVDALNSGSITSGFGNIDIGASTFTTTGHLTIGTASISGNFQTSGRFIFGDNGDTGAINTSDWDISNTGVITNAAMTSTQLTDGGTIGFDWVDAEVADALTIDTGSTLNTLSIGSGKTWTTTGTLTVGDNGDRVDFNTSGWDVANSVFSGLTGLTTTGNLSGATASMSGNVQISGRFIADTAASHSFAGSLSGAGLADCNGAGSQLLWESTAGKFACETLADADIPDTITIAGGTDIALADGGTGASLTDPNADRVFFWDDSAGATVLAGFGGFLTTTATPTLTVASDSLGFDQWQDTSTLDATTTFALAGNNFVIDLTTTGDFTIDDNGTPFCTFTDSGEVDCGPATSFELPNSAGGGTINTAGEVGIDTSSGSFNFHDGTAERILTPETCRTFSTDAVSSTDQWGGLRFFDPITITQISPVASGTGAVGWRLLHGAPGSVTTTVFTEIKSASSATSPVYTSFADATLGDGEVLDLAIASTSADLSEVGITFCYRFNAP
jgi:hypothetical protein|tara:strand:- start:734 stop:3115 length:2382 start_codon:yes stop_codon:yes gene_type:complete